MSETKVQRNYKDSIFRMLFKDKENLLSLYNALNKTDYTDVDELEITTLENAMDECIAEGILSEFLRKNRAESIKMSIYEYNEELHFKTLLEEGREQGLEEGERRINKLNSILIDLGRFDDLKRATQDKAYQEQLIIELLPEGMK